MPLTGLTGIHTNAPLYSDNPTRTEVPSVTEFEIGFTNEPTTIDSTLDVIRDNTPAKDISGEAKFADLAAASLIEELVRAGQLPSGVKFINLPDNDPQNYAPLVVIFKPIVGFDNSFTLTLITRGNLFTIGGMAHKDISNFDISNFDTSIFDTIIEVITQTEQGNKKLLTREMYLKLQTRLTKLKILNIVPLTLQGSLIEGTQDLAKKIQQYTANLEKQPA